MEIALAEGQKSQRISTAFCVGCAIISKDSGSVLACGYSRELEGNTHAEECALMKLTTRHDKEKEELVLYTTMEPCSTRLSGKKSCSELILEVNKSQSNVQIVQVVIGVKEPDYFVRCEGSSILERNGIEVRYISDEGMVSRCQTLNDHLVH